MNRFDSQPGHDAWQRVRHSLLAVISLLGLLSLSVAAAPAQAASGERILRPGETLVGAASQELRSENGHYRLAVVC